jgi:hypothetical protein
MLALIGEAYPEGLNVLGVWAQTDVYLKHLNFLLSFPFVLSLILKQSLVYYCASSFPALVFCFVSSTKPLHCCQQSCLLPQTRDHSIPLDPL